MTAQQKFIPLKDLCKSSENVRVVAANKASNKQLAASILSIGLLQNLVVKKNENGKFEVIAGGRRFDSLTSLLNDGKIADDYPVPCTIRDDDTTAISLSENLKETMHPTDEFMAYKKMFDQGRSEKEISNDFGVPTSRVKQLLKLGSLAPEILDASRSGKLSLECLMAFTVSDNHDRQIACLKDLGRRDMSPYAIRQYLLNDTIDDEDGIALFVGLKNYKAEGGGIVADLFQSKSYWVDVPLVEQLANDKLKAEAAQIEKEGWKWVEFSTEGHMFFRGLHQVSAEFGKVPAKLKDKIEKLQQKLDAFDEIDEWTDEDHDQHSMLDDEMDTLIEEQEKYREFTDEQKSFAGARVSFDQKGKLIVQRGLVKKGDMPKRETTNNNQTMVSDEDSGVESGALRSDLCVYYRQALQAELLSHEELTQDLLVYAVANMVLGGEMFDRFLDIRANRIEHVAVGIDDTKASHILAEFESGLNLSWTGFDTEGERFTHFRQLTKKEKKSIMSFCVARLAMAKPLDDDGLSQVVAGCTGFDMKKYWKPTKLNYFGRIKKDALLDIGESVDPEFRKLHLNSKKGDLADLLESMDSLSGWMPEIYC